MKKIQIGDKVYTPDGEGVVYEIDRNLGIAFVKVDNYDTNYDIDDLSVINELWEESGAEADGMPTEHL